MDELKIRVLIAADHPIFLEGLCTLLSMKFPEIEVVAAVTNGRIAVEKEKELNPDIVLMDIRMPDMDGIEAARRMKANREDLKIIMLTTFDERNLVKDSLELGASGYLLKESSIEELVNYIKIVNAGKIVLTDSAAKTIRDSTLKETKESHLDFENIGGDAKRQLSLLKKRELEVLNLVIKGWSNPEIANSLYVSEHTVRNYVSSMYHVLGVHDRYSLIAWATENRLIETSDQG